MRPGKYSSWILTEDYVAIKQCDITAHRYGLTTIDKNISDFWGTQRLKPNKDMDVFLRFRGETLETKIKATDRGQCRLSFTAPINEYLRKYDYCDYDVKLLIVKKSNGIFEVKTKREEAIREDNNNPWETIEEIKGELRAEGRQKVIYTTIYERIPEYRNEAIRCHGYVCAACGFDFEKKYGTYGKHFIEVHHVKPLYSRKQQIVPDIENDFVCLCSNCHSMIHHNRKKILKVEDLKKMIADAERG